MALVTADQMRAIEARVFAAGLPVEALMEKVGGLIARRIQTLYALPRFARVGVLVGPGHNGGDALVVARELHFAGYAVSVYQPLERAKPLTDAHAHYGRSLGIAQAQQVAELSACDFVIDGLFGFGLEREITGSMAECIEQVNGWAKPVVSIDLPSGLHTDSGTVLGTAIQAEHTLCLGLWKRGLLQDQALAYAGEAELIDFDLPQADIEAVLGAEPTARQITPEIALAELPLKRPQSTHKYKMGHLLLIAGSVRYNGAALLSALGARASGVGMLSIAVPASIKPLLVAQLPEALVIGCPETETGAIASLPEDLDLQQFHAIACGPGLSAGARAVVEQVLSPQYTGPLVLDADGLNILAELGLERLQGRSAPSLLTPHPGEFKRLFPNVTLEDRLSATQAAADSCGSIVLLKGARVVVAGPDSQAVWVNPASTPALARGGSGDVLTGLTAGLWAQAAASTNLSLPTAVAKTTSAAWWHAQAGIQLAQERTELGVDAFTLATSLVPALTVWLV
ncbi:NAD(P)H-hydrate dehydratase [Leptolyngbya sp. FACHB-261]|nr:NAD(P)H-hydrate dehydratase [Leptolyngbya sp. FACHB-261]